MIELGINLRGYVVESTQQFGFGRGGLKIYIM